MSFLLADSENSVKKGLVGVFPRRTIMRCLTFEPRYEKPNILVSDLVRHKPGCIATEDG